MTETGVVQKSPRPFTQKILTADLQAMGVNAGMTLLVHSSLSSIGYVPGGAVTVIQTLMSMLTPSGTLIMPTHSTANSDPALWQNPPVPAEWHQIVREETPPFDPLLTPTRGMGAVPELFRTWPGVFRSNHPQSSFAAWGKHAATVTLDHPLSFSLGEHSPLARLYDLDGFVLLLGVSYGNNTSFHLSEVRAGRSQKMQQGAAIWQDGRRIWAWFDELNYDDGAFPQIGADFERAYPVGRGHVGLADCRLFSQRAAVDFATEWLKTQAETNKK